MQPLELAIPTSKAENDLSDDSLEDFNLLVDEDEPNSDDQVKKLKVSEPEIPLVATNTTEIQTPLTINRDKESTKKPNEKDQTNVQTPIEEPKSKERKSKPHQTIPILDQSLFKSFDLRYLCPDIINHTMVDLDIDRLEKRPWEDPMVNLKDYFNYGMNERTWKEYLAGQIHIRLGFLNTSIAYENKEHKEEEVRKEDSHKENDTDNINSSRRDDSEYNRRQYNREYNRRRDDNDYSRRRDDTDYNKRRDDNDYNRRRDDNDYSRRRFDNSYSRRKDDNDYSRRRDDNDYRRKHR